jgi:hypothetical protein
MKQNALLITAALFCLATSALAGDKKQNSQPQPQPTQQSQMAQSSADGSKDQASSAQTDYPVKPQKHAKRKPQPSDPQSDPELWLRLYGGGG